jgi:hypothetical protein
MRLVAPQQPIHARVCESWKLDGYGAAIVGRYVHDRDGTKNGEDEHAFASICDTLTPIAAEKGE